jgi:hypothetical protein
MRLGANGNLNPRDVTVWKVVVEILGFLNGVQEPNGPHPDALSFLVLHNAKQFLGTKDSNPVEDLILSP